MKILNNLLILALLTILTNKSWASNENVQRNKLNYYRKAEISTGGIIKQVDQRISDIIAENVLHFGHKMGLELAASDHYAAKSEIFSPLSLLAALSLLTLGAKGKSYQELKQVVGIDSVSEIAHNPSKYHEEFGLMLHDLQHINGYNGGSNRRPNANWRFSRIVGLPLRREGTNADEHVEHIIKVANGLFVQKGFSLNPDYRQVLQSVYETELTELNFRSGTSEPTNYINDWVNKATFGKIPQLLFDDLHSSTNVVLASVLYFKAFWVNMFFPGTSDSNFYPDGVNKPPITVQMMNNAGIFPFYDAKEYDCRIIGLPYQGNETTMYIIQPNNSTRQKLRQLQHMLDARKINFMIDNMVRTSTILAFPKMRFTRRMSLRSILNNMNVNDIFINGYSDLSLIGKGTVPIAQEPTPKNIPVAFDSIYRNMPVYQSPIFFKSRFGDTNNTAEEPSMANSTQGLNTREKRQIHNPVSLALMNLERNRQKPDANRSDLYVDDILHNVDFSVDEKGTEAAAATAVYLKRSGPEIYFVCETPFLIVIRHDPTKLPLFYGIINKPEL